MTYDTIIIGAGMSGLAAGIRLAQFDRDVVILESHALWGGLNSFYKKGGRRFDVGLHALTNYAPQGAKGVPLTKILRQLRIRHADLKLGEQGFSEIAYPNLRLRFSNDFALFESEVHAAFPSQRDDFAKLVAAVEETGPNVDDPRGARSVLETFLSDRTLIDALLLPTCWYGSARGDDVDWDLFTILFRSLFREGMSRPEGGIRTLLKLLIDRYKSLGGELKLRSPVARILFDGGHACGVELESGEQLRAERVLSSAGYVETLGLCGAEHEQRIEPEDVGQMAFFESICMLDVQPKELGIDSTIVFFNREDRLFYRPTESPVDVRSGVLATPNGFARPFAEPDAPDEEGMLRTTAIAHPQLWHQLPDDEYKRHKAESTNALLAAVADVVPDYRDHVVYQDAFTPRTVSFYTRHVNGTVYGCPQKRRDGEIGVPGVYLIGTDQGYLGVIGAMLSGISMANRHALTPAP